MKTALLICDHVNDDLRHVQGDYADMFIELFPELDFEIYNVCEGRFPENASHYDAYITNGSRLSVYDDVDWISQLKAFVREIQLAGKKYIGVCFGHQLLAEALGGKVAKSTNGWCIGVHRFQITQQENWMTPFQQNLNLLMMCQDQVLHLPANSKVLASTDKCPVGMFQVGKMLGIQAHPEFTKEYDEALMLLREERIGEETVMAGQQSLSMKLDAAIFRDWVLQFLKVV